MTKRMRTCPETGVPLKTVDDGFQLLNGTLSIEKLSAALPDCNLFGLKQIASELFTTASARSVRHRLGLEPGQVPSSYYHLHQFNVGELGTRNIVYATHTTSLTAGSAAYEAADLARKTANQSGLRRPK